MLAAFFDRYLYHRGIAQNHQCMGCSVCNVYCAFTCYQVLLLPYFSYILYHTLSIYDLSTPPFCSIQQGEIVYKEVLFFHTKWVFTIIVYEGLSTSQDPAINSETTKPQILITFSKKILFWCVESDLEHKSKIFPIYFIGLQFVTCFCAKKHLNQIKIDNKI